MSGRDLARKALEPELRSTMNLLKLLTAGAAIGVILVAFRDRENERRLGSAGSNRAEGDDTEPFLGYAAMDQETLLNWLEAVDPDRPMLERVRAYEAAHRERRAVLRWIDEELR